MMTGLTVEGLVKRYGSVTALGGVDLHVPEGSVHAIAGPNGSGKTTLLGILGGLITPTAGRVTRPDGHVGYGFQEPNVYPDLSVRENVEVFTAMVDGDPDWACTLTNRLRLDNVLDRQARALSDGYRKKLDLVLAGLRKPPLLLLDEPLADLDELTSRRLVELVETLAQRERIVVVSTHELAAFEDVIDGLTVIYDGQVLIDRRDAAVTDPTSLYDEALREVGNAFADSYRTPTHGRGDRT